MAVKIFITGASGYIGGTVLEYLHKSHPEYEYTLLVRDEKRGLPIQAKYPNAKLIYGSLEDFELISGAAAYADIVIDTADSSDNIPAAKAIAKGLEDGHTASNPGYWIHLSGTGILTWFDADNERSGEGPLATQIYHDIDDIERLISLPASAFHRDVDIIVQGAISDAVRVAIVCPPTIYDIGSGPISTRSQQVPELVCATLHAGFAPIIGKGLTEWHNINIADIADLYLRLVDATLDPLKNNNPEIFGLRGYFFAENGFHLWADVAQWIADECYRQGYITEAATKAVTQADIDEMEGVGTVSYGCNSKGIAARAKKYLAWEPKGSGLKDTIAELVAKEALLLGVVSKN